MSHFGDSRWARQEPGFADRSESILAFDDGTRTFTITPVGSSFTYFQDLICFDIDSADSVVIPDTEGLHWIYYNGVSLLSTTTFTDNLITEFALVAAVYWDATNDEAILLCDQRHDHIMDSSTHLYNHKTIGARFGEGLLPTLANSPNGNNDIDISAQVSIAAGSYWNEDMEIAISDGSPQQLDVLQAPVFYRVGTNDWRRVAATDFPITNTGSGRAGYNLNTAGTWSLAEVTNNDFLLMHLFITSDVNNPIIAIVGQEEYTSLANVRAAQESEFINLEFGGLADLVPDMFGFASIIFQTQNSANNTPKSRVRSTLNGGDYIDWRRSLTIGAVEG